MKTFACLLLVVVAIQADNDWWDPLHLTSGRQDQPILAKLTPAVQETIPKSIQVQLAKMTAKDLLGLRALAEKLTQQPSSRADFVKELNAKSPNTLFLATEVYKVGRDQLEKARKNLNPDSVKFLRNVVQETSAALNEAATLFNKQDVGTKKNLQSVFPFIPQLIQSSKTSVQYVSKNL